MLPQLKTATVSAQSILEGLNLPATRSQTPVLVLTVGLPGSGKSTFSRRLAPEIGAVVLESDTLRSRYFDPPSHDRKESRKLFSAIYAAAGQLLGQGIPVILDATNLTERDRQPAYKLARTTGARLLVLHFTAPQEVIAQRLQGRLSGVDVDDSSTAGIDIYHRMAARFQPLAEAHLQIDTSDPALTESAFCKVVATGREPETDQERHVLE